MSSSHLIPRSKKFFRQSLNNIKLRKMYLPESHSVGFINLHDKDGNALALYESEYLKLKVYLRTLGVSNFADLAQSEKLEILKNANVKVIKYFSPENIKLYEINPSRTSFSKEGDILTQSGLSLRKGSYQNCVVMIDGHIYTHPKALHR